MRTHLALLPAACLLAACAGGPSKPNANESANAKAKPEDPITDIATTPLSDLNLVRTKIPPVLLAALNHPYAPPEDKGCSALAEQVKSLDAVLGGDLDAPVNPDDPGLVQRGVDFAGDAARGMARGVAEGVVPFRSWVRKLTGAEKHAKEVAAAIAAGVVRRSYLKGLGQAAGCEPPAAPRGKAAAGRRQTGRNLAARLRCRVRAAGRRSPAAASS